ncbi:MAG: tetratricopeptide repeat protein [Candidatus Eisenbacteria bacterium]
MGIAMFARSVWLVAAGPLLLAFSAGPSRGSGSSVVDSLAATTLRAAERRAADATLPPMEHLRALLDAGRVRDAARTASELGRAATSDPALALRCAEAFFVYQDFEPAKPYCESLARRSDLNEAEARLLYRWLDMTDDAATIEGRTGQVLRKGGSASRADLLAAGRLATNMLNLARAESCYAAVVARDSTDAAGLRGLGVVAYRRNRFDPSWDFLQRALRVEVSPELLDACTETLIRLGRTEEAIAASEWALRLNPYDRSAHYLLGNGYARRNYSELRAAQADQFLERALLAPADSLLDAGDRGGARKGYEALIARFPQAVEPLARLASLDFEEGRFRAARELAERALAILPDYGRAHAILAKALESETFAYDVHHADYEARFAALEVPEVPGIDRFVLNWKSLSPRHQKRVALSIEPWKQFVPVLLEGNATYYIKPLYMLLSDTPGQEGLRDERIGYDSRLWDDVRGCGGFHTVSGVEDVERTVFDKYNTVLHELTHQVHSVFTAEEKRELDELYRRAKERDEATHQGFSSRYAGGSVWEYFAEGANALRSPARDAYDPREITLERLVRIDPDLKRWTETRMANLDVAASRPIALTNAGEDLVSRDRLEEGRGALQRALELAPEDETALGSMVYACLVSGDTASAVASARRARDAHPASGGAWTTLADAEWRAGQPLPRVIERLARARGEVRVEDLPGFDASLGQMYWIAGDAERAIAAYDSALARQADLPEAVYGRAASYALADRFQEAWSDYESVVRTRTGWIGLRADYARDLLRAGRVADARAQVDAALLLDPRDPSARTVDAWVAWKEGATDAAKQSLEALLAEFPWLDLPRVLRGRIEAEAGNVARAEEWWAPIRASLAAHQPPSYVYRADRLSWQSTHEYHALERAMLDAATR